MEFNRSTSPTHSVLPPSQPAVDMLASYLEAAESCLAVGRLENCHQHLDLAVTTLLERQPVFTSDFQGFLCIFEAFQEKLIAAEQYRWISEWICPCQQGLLGRLANVAEYDRDLALQVLAPLEQGAERLPKSESAVIIQLQLGYLSIGCHLAKQHGLGDHLLRLLVKNGEIHLTLGRLLPRKSAYDAGFRNAAICYNIAHDLDPDCPAIRKGLSTVEQAYLEKITPSREATLQWAENLIWTGRSPQHVRKVRQIAELMVEYGDLATASSLYFTCVCYGKQFPLAESEEIALRHLQLSQTSCPPLDRFGWERNRTHLQIIRDVTSFLFCHYFGGALTPRPNISADFKPSILQVMTRMGLLPPDSENWNDLTDRLTIHQLQHLHGQLMIDFSSLLFEQAVVLCGKPPCDYALLGLGSLARGEMNIYSDLDAILLVERQDKEVVDYFKDATAYFDLLMLNLGETKCNFARFDYLKDRFCLDPALLHPRRTIETPERLIQSQREELSSLKQGSDLDPIRNAMRLTCLITGSSDLHTQYVDKLRAFFLQEGRGGALGNFLLSNWSLPNLDGALVNAKNDLYRPITLLIDALSAKYGSPGVLTVERLIGLKGVLPKDFYDLCERMLELACRLRLQAQIYYGEEQETIYVKPSAEEEHPLLLSYSDHELMLEIRHLLVAALERIDLRKSFEAQSHIWSDVKLAYLDRLLLNERIVQARALLATMSDIPAEIAASLALLDGDFQLASDLATWGESDTPTPYKRSRHHPDVPGLQLLEGLLQTLTTKGFRHPLPAPPAAIFEGPSKSRRSTLWNYLTRLPLSDEVRATVWSHASNWFHGSCTLPDSPQALFSALLSTPDADANDLLYGDLLGHLTRIVNQCLDKDLLTDLYRRFPQTLRRRFLSVLRSAGTPLPLVALIAHYPLPDGRRPLRIPTSPTWSLLPFRGSSKIRFEGIESPPSHLSPEAVQLMTSLMSGQRRDFGRHPVDELHGTFFKLFPEFPGREFAFLSFARLIIGEAYPPRELIKVGSGPEAQAVITSAAVPGPSLHKVLNECPELLQQLDFHHYSFQVVMTLLALPEDAKPDNLIVFAPPDGGPLRLIDVDVERVFFDDIKEHRFRRNELQCKSILLCLDAMKRPIDPDVCAELLAVDPAALLKRWLQEIEVYNARCFGLFGSKLIDQALQRTPSTVIPFFIEPTVRHAKSGMIRHKGLLLKLYERLVTLQQTLENHPSSTLLQLLQVMEPELGRLYGGALNRKESALLRFCSLTKSEYGRSEGSTLSITSTTLQGAYSHIKEYQNHGWTVERANEDLQQILLAHSKREAIAKDLISGRGLTLQKLDLPEVSDSVVKAIDFTQLTPTQQEQVLDRITGLHFHRLHLSGCQVLTNKRLSAILRHCPNLILLDVGNSRGLVSLSFLEKLCPRLEKLNLRGIPTLENLSNDGLLSQENLSLPALRSLDISHCRRLQRVALKCQSLQRLRCHCKATPADLSIACPPLAELHIDRKATLDRLHSLLSTRKIRMGATETTQLDSFDPSTFTRVTQIRLEGESIVYQIGHGRPSDIGQLIAIGWKTFSLTSHAGDKQTTLYVRPFDPKVDTLPLICQVARQNQILEQIDPSLVKLTGPDDIENASLYCAPATEIILSEEARGISLIIKLIVDQYPQAASPIIERIVPRSPDLTIFSIGLYIKLTDNHLTALAKSCPNLSTIKLPSNCEVTDADLRMIAEGCPLIETIWMAHCSMLTDRGLQSFAQQCHNLKHLYLIACEQLTDVGICAVLEQSPQLIMLGITGCREVSDRSLRVLAKHCPQLLSLAADHCPNITDSGLIALAQSFPGLRLLRLSGCEQLSDVGLKELAHRCSKLSQLWIDGCPDVTDAATALLLQKCPHLVFKDLKRLGPLSTQRPPEIDFLLTLKRCPVVTELDLSKSMADPSGERLGIVANQYPNLTSLTVAGTILEGDYLKSLEQLTSLTTLAIRYSKIAEPEIIDLAQSLLKLTHLEIRQSRLSQKSSVLWQHFNKLRHVNLAGLEGYDDETLHAQDSFLYNVEELNLSQCDQISDNTFLALNSDLSKLTKLDLTSCSKLTDKGLSACLKRCPNLASLAVSGCTEVTGSAFAALEADLPNLTHLDLSSCSKLSDRNLESLLERAPNLKELRLFHCSDISDGAFAPLAMRGSALERLEMKSCEGITDRAVGMIAHSCPRLHSLTLAYCPNVTDRGIRMLVQKCRLIKLDVSGCEQLTDEPFLPLSGNGHSLKELSLAFCEQVTDRTITAVAMGCPSLRKLNLSGCSKLTHESLATLAEHRPLSASPLSRIDIDCCWQLLDRPLFPILELFPIGTTFNLKTLHLRHYPEATDSELATLAEHCSDLKELDLTNCTALTGECFEIIAKTQPHIETLKLECCTGLTSRGLKAIAKLPFLTSLDLSRCTNVTGLEFLWVGKCGTCLGNIILSRCTEMTSEGLHVVARTFKYPKTVDLSFCSQLTNDDLLLFAQELVALRKLHLTGCFWLMDETLKQLLTIHPKLQELNIRGCDHVSDGAIQALQAAYPELKIDT